jgi:enoyl-CoA hydratase
MVLTGQRVGAAEGARSGLVDRVVPRAELERAAMLLAAELAEQPARALQRARASIARLAGHGGKT